MSPHPLPPAAILSEHALSAPVFVERTGIATIWKVTRQTGEAAALKLYHGETMGNEGAGFVYLEALNGAGAARVFAHGARFAVTEWLPGPSLGDLSRRGEDDTATHTLLTVAQTLHAQPVTPAGTLPKLADWFGALLKLHIASGCPATARQNLERCRALAGDLLATPQDPRPLHGDLHHDNIRLGARGYCAFDAKGVLGERAYELANAFRNPKGAPALLRDPDRIRALRDAWSGPFAVPPRRLMQWAAVKCALSIAWRSGSDGIRHDDEFDLLAQFLAISEEG
ncbi:aminoglycoside phosphotransferase family protein [Cognatishimia sp. MH4019]|uniref:aminoglycoside phosphotransferase family protein n=1 Tax=Cognatishimia sp. MH4019 TaxID=2854030 RepID=UPI001CD4FBD9|nr:aminoglycoside phosphotransferase family protein [Cognatishimia sp. MH4019]